MCFNPVPTNVADGFLFFVDNFLIEFMFCLNYNKIMKRPLIIVVAAVAVFVVGYFFFFLRSGELVGPQFPDYFPKEMIADPYVIDLEIDESDTKLANESKRLAVSYKSHANLEESAENFKSYFQANGYTLANIPPTNNDQRFVAASKDKISVGITLWERSPLLVSILYIIQK